MFQTGSLVNLDTNNVTSMLGIFYDANNIKTINISNLKNDKLDNSAYTFHQCLNLEKLIINNIDANLINSLFNLLPDRTSTSVGITETNASTSYLNLSIAQSKNWNIA